MAIAPGMSASNASGFGVTGGVTWRDWGVTDFSLFSWSSSLLRERVRSSC